VATEVQTCYRHPDQAAGVVCQRCDRPICPQCMHTASVGFHCPECTHTGAQRVYTARSLRVSPILTTVLIGINVAVYVLGMFGSGADAVGGRAGELANEGGLIARAFYRGELVGVAEGEWYRLLTSGFLHAGLLHLGFNMYALWILGGMIEPAVGRVKFGLIYFVSLLAGSLGALIVEPNVLTVGASGAIYGLMGAALAAQRAQGIDVRSSGLIGLLVINLLFTFAIPGISIGGHLGGLAGGFVAGFIVADLPLRVRNDALPIALAALVAAGCVAAAISVANAA
jgi:membrane associated rhomboid family serine protease